MSITQQFPAPFKNRNLPFRISVMTNYTFINPSVIRNRNDRNDRNERRPRKNPAQQ